jgi:hypothetical protein
MDDPDEATPLSREWVWVQIAVVVTSVLYLVSPTTFDYHITTNFAYTGAAFAAYLREKETAALVLAQLGAYSFAHHVKGIDLTQGLDNMSATLTGMFLTAYATEITIIKNTEPTPRRANAISLVYALLVAGLTVFATWPETLQAGMAEFAVMIAVVATPVVTCRAMLSTNRSGIWLAVGEVFVILVVVAGSMGVQGELGRTLTGGTVDYSVFHGMWHVHISFVLVLLFARLSDASRVAVGDTLRVSRIPREDVALVCIMIAVLTAGIVVKELKSDETAVKVYLGLSAFVFGVHAFWARTRIGKIESMVVPVSRV